MTCFSFSRGKTGFFLIFFGFFIFLFFRELSILLAFRPQLLYTCSCVSMLSAFLPCFPVLTNIFAFLSFFSLYISIFLPEIYIHLPVCVYLQFLRTGRKQPGTSRFRAVHTIYGISICFLRPILWKSGCSIRTRALRKSPEPYGSGL